MTTSERVRKLFSSPVFIFLFSGFFFGVFMQLSTTRSHSFSWSLVAITGIPFGLIMVVTTTQRMKRLRESTGITDQNQAQRLRASFKTGKLPSDPKDLEALPAFLHKISSMYAKTSKRGMAFLVAVVFVNLLTGLGSHNIFLIIISMAVLAGIIVIYFSVQRTTAKIDSLYRQLDIKPETPTTTWSQPSEAIKKTTKALFEFGIGYCGFIVALTGVLLCFAVPELTFKLGAPLIVVGLLFLAPYYLLRGRWAATYASFLALAITILVYLLYTPVGRKMHVPAHIPFPGQGHSLLAYAEWAVFHSALVFVILGTLILLDMVANKSENAGWDKNEWFKTIAIVVAIAILTLPIRFGHHVQHPQTPHSQNVTGELTSPTECIETTGGIFTCPTSAYTAPQSDTNTSTPGLPSGGLQGGSTTDQTPAASNPEDRPVINVP